MLNDGAFRVLRIRAKQKMCAHTEMICHEDFCPFAEKYSEKMKSSGLLSHIATTMSYFDPDITFELSRTTEVCPFEVSLELIEQADVIVCDYNYIFDPYVGLKAYQQESDYGDCVLFLEQRVEWERIVMSYIGWKIENRIVEEDDPVIDFYFRIVKFTNLLNEGGEEFSHLIERTPDGLRLKIFCKDPSRFLGKIFDSAHATIALSATLEPFDFYRKTLGLPEKRVSELSLPSQFPRTNRKIVVVSEVDTTYKQRANHYDRIAETVADIAEAAEGNFLSLFPSYAFLREVAQRMPPIRKRV